MDFTPIVDNPQPMDARIFRPEPMGLERELLGLRVPRRAHQLRRRAQHPVPQLRGPAGPRREATWRRCRTRSTNRCQQIGQRVKVVVNYDYFRIDESLLDAYAKMIRHMEDTYYITVTRYTTSAFLRAKLGEELSKRNVAPHVFETAAEAQAFHAEPAVATAG